MFLGFRRRSGVTMSNIYKIPLRTKEDEIYPKLSKALSDTIRKNDITFSLNEINAWLLTNKNPKSIMSYIQWIRQILTEVDISLEDCYDVLQSYDEHKQGANDTKQE